MVEIPDELIRMFREQRVIPFVGSGMSANLDLPDWDTLLRRIHEDNSLRGRGVTMDGPVSYEQLQEFAGNDRLRVAEFFYLLAGKQMGIIRRVIEPFLSGTDPNRYGGYTDLVNLGAPLIYTTNFDDLIEKAHLQLGLDVQPIVNPRDIALSRAAGAPQIVKYHGDLSDDASLVLTESSYYRRLNFEAPLDLKFRADLLGRSVLFIGYSFSDPNVRVIWFRLLDMMQDVDTRDRPRSYMVTFASNPVQERLYRDAGIEPIVLDPEGVAPPDSYGDLLADFLCSLATAVSDPSIPGTNLPPYASLTLVKRVSEQLRRLPRIGSQRVLGARSGTRDLQRLSEVRYPEGVLAAIEALFGQSLGTNASLVRLAMRLIAEKPDSVNVASHLFQASASRTPWELSSAFSLDHLAGVEITEQARQFVLSRMNTELSFHEEQGGYDADLFYLIRPVWHLSRHHFGASANEAELAEGLLSRVNEKYDGVVEEIAAAVTGPLDDIVERWAPEDAVRSIEIDPDDLPF